MYMWDGPCKRFLEKKFVWKKNWRERYRIPVSAIMSMINYKLFTYFRILGMVILIHFCSSRRRLGCNFKIMGSLMNSKCMVEKSVDFDEVVENAAHDVEISITSVLDFLWDFRFGYLKLPHPPPFSHTDLDFLMENLDILCGLQTWLPQINPLSTPVRDILKENLAISRNYKLRWWKIARLSSRYHLVQCAIFWLLRCTLYNGYR